MSVNYSKTIKEKKSEAERIMNPTQLKKCHAAIHTAAVASGAAGVIPIPAADAVPISAAQVTMVIALGRIFGQELTESAVKGLIGAAASTFVGRSLVKFIPLIGWQISSAVAAGVTEAIGWTIAVDFAKEAKRMWRNHQNESSRNANTTHAHEDSNDYKDNDDEIISTLETRANPFITYEKTVSDNKQEYDLLIQDFEKVLDDIPEDDPLRKLYDDLCLLDV